MAYIKFGDRYTIRKTAKLKQSPNILVTWYTHVMVYSIANILNIKNILFLECTAYLIYRIQLEEAWQEGEWRL